jgi:hypothetical protein
VSDCCLTLDRNRVSLFLTGIEEREQKIVAFPREQSVKKAGTKHFYETSLNFYDLIVCVLQNEKTKNRQYIGQK